MFQIGVGGIIPSQFWSVWKDFIDKYCSLSLLVDALWRFCEMLIQFVMSINRIYC